MVLYGSVKLCYLRCACDIDMRMVFGFRRTCDFFYYDWEVSNRDIIR
jgi:hypothetical protein